MTGTESKAPLDEVMLAMDVVDTLRHRERVVERALSAEEQDRELVARLREIYAGQGIEVSDTVIERGVEDLRANRFVYAPTAPSFERTLARIYVSRRRWGVPAGIAGGVLAAALVGYQVFVAGPERAANATLPGELEQAYTAVVDLAEAPAVDAEAGTIFGDGQLALEGGDYSAARAAVAELDGLLATLRLEYEVRVVSRPGESSGIIRGPEDDPQVENLYLIVEAVDADGNRLTVPVTNEEDGGIERVSRWGQRVEAAAFEAVRSDKQDDGIIQEAVMGEKRRGRLLPDYGPGVLGGAITDW